MSVERAVEPGDVDAELEGIASRLDRGRELLAEGQEQMVAAYRDASAAFLLLSRQLAGADGATVDHLLDETDRAILAGLARGRLHTQLARELAIPRRTINRRLKRLRELTGTTTSFQLGVAACTLHWLPTNSP